MPESQRTILVTGASGLIGQAVIERLDGRVIALTHATDVPGETIGGNVAEPRLGLAPEAHAELARRVDAVVHCAALTDYTAGRKRVREVNVDGTRHVLELCAQAEAALYHLSTAFVAAPLPAATNGDRRVGPEVYVESKQAGEEVVRASGLPAVIVRPSILIGDTESGRSARFQGIHVLIKFLLQGSLAMVPVSAGAHVDLIAQDVVADALAGLVADEVQSGEVWLSAGAEALTAQRLAEVAIGAARDLGIDVEPPRFVDPEVVDRLIRPALLPAFPGQVRRRFEQLLELVALFFTDVTFPSSLAALERAQQLRAPVDAERAFANTVRFWAVHHGYGAAA